MFDELIEAVVAYLTYLIDQIAAWFANLASQLSVWISELVDGILAWFAYVMDSVASTFLAMAANLQAWFKSALATIQTVFVDILNKILQVTTVVVDAIRQYANSVFNEIRMAVSWLLSTIQSWFDAAIGAVIGLINAGIDAVADTATAIHAKIVEVVGTQIQIGEALALETSKRIAEAYEDLLVGPTSMLASLEEKLGGLRESLGEAATKLVQGLTDLDEATFKPIREKVVGFFDGLMGEGSGADRDELIENIVALTAGEQTGLQIRERWAKFFMDTAPRSQLWASVVSGLVFVVGAVPAMLQIASMAAQPVSQEYAREYPFQLFAPNEAIAAWRRDIIGKPEAVEHIRRLGYSIDHANELLNSSRQVPALPDMLSMRHRELIPAEKLDKGLFQLGLEDDWLEAVKRASFMIPPVQDLITMAVREVFTPEIVAEFGQMDEFPEAFATWTEKQGLTVDWARNYWAAHWALPSVNQAFEMFHRGEIDERKLRLLLRALDVMPGWVEPLIKIAYRPYTRVDIRRMHKREILSDEQTQRAYKDLGYDDEKSKGLLDFTIALNGPKNLDDDIELGKLSRSTILGFYSDGLVNAARTVELLIGIGHTDDAARLYVESADSDDERRERKAETDLVLAQVQAGALTFEEGHTKLLALGLETLEVEKATTRLVRILEQKTKIPSRSEGEAMLVAGVIPLSEYRDLLERIGYGPKWIDAYEAMARKKASAAQKRG